MIDRLGGINRKDDLNAHHGYNELKSTSRAIILFIINYTAETRRWHFFQDDSSRTDIVSPNMQKNRHKRFPATPMSSFSLLFLVFDVFSYFVLFRQEFSAYVFPLPMSLINKGGRGEDTEIWTQIRSAEPAAVLRDKCPTAVFPSSSAMCAVNRLEF